MREIMMILILILVFAVFIEVAIFIIRMLLKNKKTDEEETIDDVIKRKYKSCNRGFWEIPWSIKKGKST